MAKMTLVYILRVETRRQTVTLFKGDWIKLAVCMSGSKPLPPFGIYLWMMAKTSQALIL